jgi:hypothetical protein
MEPTVKNILNYLEDQGWTELIDSRFEREVIKDVKFIFPNITTEVLEQVLDLVIISRRPNK